MDRTALMMTQAIILFAHGARSAAWAEPFERLRTIVQARSPQAQVGLAYLELMSPSLPELVSNYAQAGVTQVTVVPIFLGQGGHIRRDLPLLIETLNKRYPHIQIEVAVAVGEDEQVLKAIANYCIAVSS
jgi:sirohydrochlorin cobaltochelatase